MRPAGRQWADDRSRRRHCPRRRGGHHGPALRHPQRRPRALPRRADRLLPTGCSAPSFEAEDAVQETFIRAWRGPRRSRAVRASARGCTGSRRTSASTCSERRQRRARPVDMSPARSADNPLPDALPENVWIEPVPDARVVPERRRPGRGRDRPRVGPPRVRRRAPEPAAATAGRADPARGAALACRRGRRAARHDRRVGEQRAPAGARHARQP